MKVNLKKVAGSMMVAVVVVACGTVAAAHGAAGIQFHIRDNTILINGAVPNVRQITKLLRGNSPIPVLWTLLRIARNNDHYGISAHEVLAALENNMGATTIDGVVDGGNVGTNEIVITVTTQIGQYNIELELNQNTGAINMNSEVLLGGVVPPAVPLPAPPAAPLPALPAVPLPAPPAVPLPAPPAVPLPAPPAAQQLVAGAPDSPPAGGEPNPDSDPD